MQKLKYILLTIAVATAGNCWAAFGYPDWTHTSRIVLTPINCTETNSYVKLKIDYEDSMRTDFRDLRFYNSSGDTLYSFAQVTDETVAGDSSVWWIRLNTRRASGDTMWASFCNFTADSVTWETEDELIAGEYTTTEAPLVEVPISGLISSQGRTEQTWFWPYQWTSGIKEYQMKYRLKKTGYWPDFFLYQVFIGLGGDFANCAGTGKAGEETWYLDEDNVLHTVDTDVGGTMANYDNPGQLPDDLGALITPSVYTYGTIAVPFGDGSWSAWETVLIRQSPRGTVYVNGVAYPDAGWNATLTKCIYAVYAYGHTSFPDAICEDCDDTMAELQMEAKVLTHDCAPDSTVEEPTMEIPVSTDPDDPRSFNGDFVGAYSIVEGVSTATGVFTGVFDGSLVAVYNGSFIGSFDGTDWSGDFEGFFVGDYAATTPSPRSCRRAVIR